MSIPAPAPTKLDIGNGSIEIVRGSIEYQGGPNSAIVNAAATDLREGGGVCGYIFAGARELSGPTDHRMADEIKRQKDVRRAAGQPDFDTAAAIITPSYDLGVAGPRRPASAQISKIIHTIGPRWHNMIDTDKDGNRTLKPGTADKNKDNIIDSVFVLYK